MKPRVFVSSTYFDLKHVRERLERFIENYCFEPVLFESDSVIFEHNTPLDISCYNEVKLCHMMILIVGGRYGSIVSGEKQQEKKNTYNKEYISITRREFDTALKLNIPIFVFIEKNVYAEYHTYNKNKDFFDSKTLAYENNFSFAHVDDINVFKFINVIKGIAIKTFERIEDIEHYLSNQIAGMLYLYLQQLQDFKDESKVLNSVSELQSIANRMNEMLTAVGKNIIQDESFKDVVFNQNKILIEFFVTQFIDNIRFKDEVEISDDELNKIYHELKTLIFNPSFIQSLKNAKDFSVEWHLKEEQAKKFESALRNINKQLIIDEFHYFKIIENYLKNIFPIIENNKELENYLDLKLKSELNLEIQGLPF